MKPLPQRKKLRQAQRLAEAASIGIAFPLALAIGFLWGSWMDRLFHTSPYLTYVFSGFGVVAGFLNAVRIAVRLSREEEENRGQ